MSSNPPKPLSSPKFAKPLIEPHEEGSLLRVQVQPKSSRNAVTLDNSGPVRVYVTAPPAEGAANKALVRILAKRLGIAKSRIKIASGHNSRKKSVVVENMEPASAATALAKQ